ncbi:hypothetical protein [Pseudobacter ginsenosidimutans]|uniref:hypothetical protein n=1 Tax=Pseudobacter ginsenosidimutans TaxID=661488 RepID=UPI00102E021A|nr:hypothetical protein [Pseudobacter ginsenosidimutans]QEC40524.1 hypothetical protein FSB84_01990 [Pseudobacter ginsenosidimutans]
MKIVLKRFGRKQNTLIFAPRLRKTDREREKKRESRLKVIEFFAWLKKVEEKKESGKMRKVLVVNDKRSTFAPRFKK